MQITVDRAAAAKLAGAKGVSAAPMTNTERHGHYLKQSGGRVTSRQSRRLVKRLRRAGDFGVAPQILRTVL